MINSIERVFHPIGQGAFYSERHDDFNIVYDCGEWKNTKESDLLVKNSFMSNSVIDILFISHFDFDHVSKIDVLKNTFRIKTCVLPLLYKQQMNILKNFYASQGQNNVSDLISNPQEYFGSQTKIISVEIGNDEGQNNGETAIPYDSLESSQKLKSGTGISIKDWIYIPYNINYSQRHEELKNLFKQAGLDIDLFQKDIDYGVQNRKLIKQIYEKTKGGINFNSMLLYSGPQGNSLFTLRACTRCYRPCCENLVYINCFIERDRTACIFTGDADLNHIDIEKIFQRYWRYVGTIQIPHHGDAKSFDVSLLKERRFVFPVSYGKTNTYGHPADNIITEITRHESFPVHVNEDKDSIYIQLIKNNV